MLNFTSLLTCIVLSGLCTLCSAGYTLKDDYSGANFFSMFDFFTDADPTQGYVDYISQSAAQSAGLVKNTGGQIYMGVDSTSVASGRGRKSVRIASKAVYNHALIVLDLAHMPEGCGTWPAFWTVGPNWPSSGEIDIIEGVNNQGSNAMTLHTGPGCSIPKNGGPQSGSVDSSLSAFSGSIMTTNCDIKAAGQAENAGCQIATSQSNSYGAGLNANQGGVYATQWDSNAIRIWYFSRGTAPTDALGDSPDPSGWGTPLASFTDAGCNIDQFFKNQQIVFDTTFCGQWAGNVWSTDSTCSAKAVTCQEYVQNNPAAFKDAYWSINALKVYSNDNSASTPKPAQSQASKVSMSASVSAATPISVSSRTPVASIVPSSAQLSSAPVVSSAKGTGRPSRSFDAQPWTASTKFANAISASTSAPAFDSASVPVPVSGSVSVSTSTPGSSAMPLVPSASFITSTTQLTTMSLVASVASAAPTAAASPQNNNGNNNNSNSNNNNNNNDSNGSWHGQGEGWRGHPWGHHRGDAQNSWGMKRDEPTPTSDSVSHSRETNNQSFRSGLRRHLNQHKRRHGNW